MDATTAILALQRTGEQLTKAPLPATRVTIYLVGGVAGMVIKALPAEWTTSDCDVIILKPEACREPLHEAADRVAIELGLSKGWLSEDCRMFAWMLPHGWQKRCRVHADYGPLRVMVPDRFDLIVSKVIGAPKRPQDRDDLWTFAPSADELRRIEQHLDQIDSETEPGHSTAQRRIVSWLRTRTDPSSTGSAP